MGNGLYWAVEVRALPSIRGSRNCLRHDWYSSIADWPLRMAWSDVVPECGVRCAGTRDGTPFMELLSCLPHGTLERQQACWPYLTMYRWSHMAYANSSWFDDESDDQLNASAERNMIVSHV